MGVIWGYAKICLVESMFKSMFNFKEMNKGSGSQTR